MTGGVLQSDWSIPTVLHREDGHNCMIYISNAKNHIIIIPLLQFIEPGNAEIYVTAFGKMAHFAHFFQNGVLLLL